MVRIDCLLSSSVMNFSHHIHMIYFVNIAKAAYDSARQFQTSLSSLVKSNESLQSSVSAWAFHEQEAVRSLNGKYNGQADPVLRDGDNVSKLLGRTSTLYAEKVSLYNTLEALLC